MQIDEHVTLPKNICKNCELSLCMAFEFRVNALKTQEIIIEYLKELKKNDITKEKIQSQNIRSDIKNEYEEIMDLEPSDECPDTLEEDITECSLENLNEDELENNALINEEEECEEQDHTSYLISEQEENEIQNYSESHHNTEDELDENEESRGIEEQEDEIEKELENDGHDFKFGNTTSSLKISIKTSSKSISKNEKSLEGRTHSNSVNNMKQIPRRGRKPTNANNHIGYICDICGNIFSKRGRMTEHRQRHDKELKFHCE